MEGRVSASGEKETDRRSVGGLPLLPELLVEHVSDCTGAVHLLFIFFRNKCA